MFSTSSEVGATAPGSDRFYVKLTYLILTDFISNFAKLAFINDTTFHFRSINKAAAKSL